MNKIINIKMEKMTLFVLLLVFLAGFVSAANDLSADNLFLKVSVSSGGSIIKTLTISSVSGGNVNLEVFGLKGVSLNDKSFSLGAGESKQVLITFDSSEVEPGVYAGEVKLTNAGEEVVLPVVFEIESTDVFFDLTLEVPSNYLEVQPGEKINIDVKIFDLTANGISSTFGATNVDMAYFIYKADGSLISTEKESVAIDKEKQFSKTFTIPADAAEGDYILTGEIRYESSVGTSSRLLAVKKKSFAMESFVLPFLLIFLIICLVVLAIVYLIHNRSKKRFAKRLRGHSINDLRKQKKLLLAKKKVRALEKEDAERLAEIESLEKMITRKQIEDVEDNKA